MKKLTALGTSVLVAGVLGTACAGGSSALPPYQAGEAFARAYYTVEGTAPGLRNDKHCVDIASEYTGRVPDDQEGTANDEPAAASSGQGAAAQAYKGCADQLVALRKASYAALGQTTTTTSASTMTPPPPPSTSTPDLSSFAGAWYRHDTKGLTIDASGHGSVGLPDFTACPNCSFGGAPTNTIVFALRSLSNGGARGTVTSVTDPTADTGSGKSVSIGDAVQVILVSSGQLQLNIGGTEISTFCSYTLQAAQHVCGA